VLSFKGLALNLGLGFASLLYTGYVALLRTQQEGLFSEDVLRETIFLDALRGFPVYFLTLFFIVFFLGGILLKPRSAILSKR